MRAAGTSLVLAHGHHAAPAFNALFYATIATIIPVLFLAAAVQGRAYQDLLAAAFPARERRFTGTRRQQQRARNRVGILRTAAIAIVAFSVAGELEALISLQVQSAPPPVTTSPSTQPSSSRSPSPQRQP